MDQQTSLTESIKGKKKSRPTASICIMINYLPLGGGLIAFFPCPSYNSFSFSSFIYIIQDSGLEKDLIGDLEKLSLCMAFAHCDVTYLGTTTL